MISRYFVVVMVAGACGTVNGDDTTTYKGMLDQTPAMTFGGAPYCSYTIALKQLDVELEILPSEQVTAGKVQALNVEAVVPTTPPCPYGPAGPTISNYTFASAMSSTSGMTLTFQGAATNTPVASLEVELLSVGSVYQARLGFHRTDVSSPLDWSVLATVPLSAQ